MVYAERRKDTTRLANDRLLAVRDHELVDIQLQGIWLRGLRLLRWHHSGDFCRIQSIIFQWITQQADWKKEIRRYYFHEAVEGDDTETGREIDTSDVEVNDDESIGNGGLEEACKETGQVDKKKNTMALKKRGIWGLRSDD